MRGKRKRQAHHGGQLRPVQAGAQQPQRHPQPGPRHGANALAWLHRFKVIMQFLHILRKRVGTGMRVAAQRAGGQLVGAGSAAQAQVNASWVQRGQRAKLLGNHQRGMVGQHHAAGTDANGVGAARHVAYHHRRGGAGHAGVVVVLCQPEALVAQFFGLLGQRQRVAKGVGGGVATNNRREVKH